MVRLLWLWCLNCLMTPLIIENRLQQTHSTVQRSKHEGRLWSVERSSKFAPCRDRSLPQSLPSGPTQVEEWQQLRLHRNWWLWSSHNLLPSTLELTSPRWHARKLLHSAKSDGCGDSWNARRHHFYVTDPRVPHGMDLATNCLLDALTNHTNLRASTLRIQFDGSFFPLK